MSSDEAALLRLWREKRGEVELEDLSPASSTSRSASTKDLNRRWYQKNTGVVVSQQHLQFIVVGGQIFMN